MTRVLLVEDDVEIAQIIKSFLAMEDCYDVVWSKTAAEAISQARDSLDVILLDVMLPDENGIELCKRLRAIHHCPILFVSCLDDSATIIQALNSGGDDYIVKPFDNHVLHAKIQATLRRVRMEHAPQPENRLSCRGFSLDTPRHLLLRAGREEPLTPTEFRILAFFMQNPGQYFYPAEVYRRIWKQSSYGDNRTVVVHIHSLRKKIEDDPAHPRYLKSVWGKGYFFDPEGEEGAGR